MCEIDWPSENTLDVPTIRNVHRIITGDPGHPAQFPYIDQWLEIAELKLPWIWFCVYKEKGQPLQKENKPPILKEPPEEALPVLPPPYMPQAIPNAPLPSQESLDTPPPPISPQLDSPEPVGRYLCSALRLSKCLSGILL